MSATKPDNAAAIEFLRLVYPDGPWVLTAIKPDRKAIETRTFRSASEVALGEWLATHNGERNIYWSVNPPMRDLSKKAVREDIKEVTYLHVDVDPRSGEDLESERERCLALFADKLPADVPQPTVLLFSGGGYQAFWKLEQPLPIDGDVARAEDAKRYNQQLERLFGGDNCHNIDRVMRLPGTVNLPNDVKRKKGRIPALAKLVFFEPERIYALDKFTPATAVIATAASSPLARSTIGDAIRTADPDELDAWRVPDRVKVIMVQGRHPDEPKDGDDSRSAWVFDFACNMVRAGVPDERTLGVLLDPDYEISASIIEKPNAHRYAMRQIERAIEHVKLDVDFSLGENGKVKPTQHNIRVALQKLGVSLRHDIFADRQLIDGLPGFDVLSDRAINRLRLEIEARYQFLPAKEFFYDVVSDVALAQPFHPVRDYLDDQRWDGEPRIDRWLTTYGGAEDNKYTRAVGELLLIAAVRRVRQPGCKFDEMLVLECSQGTDKSSALRVLAVKPEWFTDDIPLDADAATAVEKLRNKWIAEASELNGMRKGQIEHHKSFLSRQADIARPAYGRLTVETPRQCVFIGTTNNDRYLRDETGNRRFWPVRIAAFNIAQLQRDRDQLWAEAAHYEALGRSIRLDPTLYALAAAEQEARRSDDPYVAVFREALGDHEGKLKSIDAWTVLNIPVGQRTQVQSERLGAAMRELGWERKKLRLGGPNPDWCYVKGHAKHLRRIMVERSSSGYVRVFYDGVRAEPSPF